MRGGKVRVSEVRWVKKDLRAAPQDAPEYVCGQH